MAPLKLPISTRILVTLFLNIVLVTAGGALFVHWQSLSRLDFIVDSVTQARLQAFASELNHELNHRSLKETDSLLRQFAKDYEVTLGLYTQRGEKLAGSIESLPASFTPHLTPRNQRSNRPPPPPPPGGPGQANFRPPPPAEGRSAPGETRLSEGPFRIMLDEDPRSGMHWAAVKLSARSADEPGSPLLLVIQSPTSGGKLFFDGMPWLLALGSAVIGSLALWVPLVMGYERRLNRLARTTDQIAAGVFTARVTETSSAEDEISELGRSVNSMATRLQEHAEGQKRFLSDVAHELASPIARMQAALGLLEQNVSPNGVHHLERLDAQVQTMGQLINELLLFSKEQLKTPPKGQPTSLLSTINRAVEREIAPDFSVSVNVSPSLSILCLPHLLERALANILRNSVRYAGPAGSIEIVARHDDRQQVELSLKDSGPGVAESELPRLFEAFYRPSQARDSDSGGSGLGLAIVKSCIESSGGAVTARNAVPHGFEVIITLQAAPGTTEMVLPETASQL